MVRLLAAAAVLLACAAQAAAEEPRFVPFSVPRADVEVLYGDPSKPGPFVMRIRELAGTTIPPHRHPVDEHITVLAGIFEFAVGETWDPALLRPYGPGSYIFVPRGRTMFGRAREAAVVQVHGQGPFDIHWRHPLLRFEDEGAAKVFRFARGQRVVTPRGSGEIRQGWASGPIVQYEVEGEGGLFMADEGEVRAAP